MSNLGVPSLPPLDRHAAVEVRALRGTKHVSSDEAMYEVGRLYGGKEEVSDSVALTVASWFQSSGITGPHLASLASGSWVNLDRLLLDIHNTRLWTVGLTIPDRLALDMLATWAIAKGRESVNFHLCCGVSKADHCQC